MPVTYTKDKNGRWVSRGSVSAQDAVPVTGPVGFGGKPKAKRKPAEAKPWYWHLSPAGIANNLKYEAKRAKQFNRLLPGERKTFPGPVSQQIAAGILAKAPADAALSLVNLLQRSGESQTKNPYLGYLQASTGGPFGSILFGLFGTARDPETTAPGRAIVRARRAATKALGARLPEQYSPEDRLYEDIPAGFAANIAVAPFTAGAGGLVRGTGVASKLAKAGVNSGLVKTAASAARWAAGLAANEAAANLVTDNTEGGASQLIKATGAPWPDALTANPKRDDRISAALRETPASMGFAAGIGALGGALKGGLGQAPHVARALRENRAAQEMRRARAVTVENGLQRENPDTGEHEFTPAAKEPPPPPPPRTPGEYDAATLEEYRRRLQDSPSAPDPAAPPAPSAKPIPTREGGDFTDFGKAQPAPLPMGHNPALDPWKDDAAYQDWLRRNSSNALVPIKPAEPAAPAGSLPRQPLPPRDELRGEGLADPWGMGPDPNSPVQRELGRKAGAGPQGSGAAAAAAEDSSVAEEIFDPELPEIDHAALALDRLDPEVVSQIAQTPGPVLPQIEEALASRQPVAPRPELASADVTVSTSKLDDDTRLPRRDQWFMLPETALLGVFHPEVNPGLFEFIYNRTGREFSELTRSDALEALAALSDQGTTVIPSRLAGGIELARTADLFTDAVRFQYKLNTNRQGVQRGNSLEGLERWNPNMEGVIQVWEDPADGKLYVVNGHNRLAKALELGIPTLPIKRLLAKNAEQARAMGALENIGSGSGTPWDAAKYFRETGIADEAQAAAAGIPLRSEHKMPQRGLQLAPLPDNIFQAGLTGDLPEPYALRLGGSGLSPEKMQAVWSEFKGDKDFRSEGGFQELIDFAREAPTTAADSGGRVKQTEIPGMEGVSRDLTKLKLKLAREIGKELGTEKRALKGASRNAETLEAKGGNQINAESSMQAGVDAERLGLLFSQLKYQSGPIGDLLNKGAEEIAAGAKLSAVARRIQGELAQAASQVVAPEPQAPKAVAPVELAPEPPRPRTEQDALSDQLLVLNRAAAQGEVRPSATPIPEPPAPPEVGPSMPAGGINAEDVANSADALKLAQQQRQAALDAGDTAAAGAWDAEIRKINQGRLAAEVARRSATQTGLFGVEELDSSMPLFDQARLDAEEARLEAEYLDRDTAAQQAIARAEREASGYEEKTFDQKVAEHGIADGWQMPESAPPAAAAGGGTAATARQFTFPADLAKSRPRYGMATLTFSNDIDRAAYILRDATKKSKGEDRLIQSLEAAGFDVAEVRQHGKRVHASVKQLIAQQTGTAAAPQKAMNVTVPSSSFPRKLNSIKRSTSDDDFLDQPLSDKLREFWQEELRRIIHKVAGDDVVIRFNEEYVEEQVSAEWGGKPGEMGRILGSYRPPRPPDFLDDYITINGTGYNSIFATGTETAYHEAFHRIQYVALGESEARVLDSAWARIKIAIGSSHLMDQAKISYGESMPSAVQRYAAARQAGKDPTTYLLQDYAPDTAIGKLALKFFSGVDRVLDIAERIYWAFRGEGFVSTRSVFEDFFKGNLIRRYDYSAVPLGRTGDLTWFEETWNYKDVEAFDKATALSSALREADQGKVKGASARAWRLAENGDSSQLMREMTDYAERRIAELDAEIESIKERAITEGC